MSENMPVNVEIDNGIGSVTFADDVIAIIAGLAATEVKGVANMLGNMSSSITEMMGKKDHAKGVKVEVGTEEAAVDLYLVLNYGINIPDVCRAVQENVKKAIETMTGLRVVEVNVNGANMTVSLDIRREYIKSVKITVVDMLDRTITQVVNTGENGYYNPGSGSNTGSSGVWDGTFKDNTSSGSDNTNGWTGYYDDSSKDYTTYYVTCRTLNVRKSDSARSTKVGTLRRNAKVHVYNIQDGWAVIDYKGNLRYVSARYLSR